MTAALTLTSGHEAAHEAAQIWALAKARRDEDTAPASAEEVLPGVQRRLRVPGAELIVASQGGQAVGFTLFAPRAECLEIFYLAVAPDAWGRGVAAVLLASVEEFAHGISRPSVDLWVISDNDRAISVYQRTGFIDSGELHRDAASGRSERRMVKVLG
ncbi:GNAT family N-acetyltransferase [Arthrobacter psychrolactophilus]|uniref:GNAT family N-acetyltransferase n=1 Tax=Arthrobacter psychrolactophilus TaxID=92442 RepID=UPI0015E8E8D8|nr:GNAT family N-acetyltransferase [Arthrobacter psychrolactophilus]